MISGCQAEELEEQVTLDLTQGHEFEAPSPPLLWVEITYMNK